MVKVAITPQQLTQKIQQIKDEAGISLSPIGGTTTYKGVVIAYSYDGAALLTATILHHPMLEPDSLIERELTNFLSPS